MRLTTMEAIGIGYGIGLGTILLRDWWQNRAKPPRYGRRTFLSLGPEILNTRVPEPPLFDLGLQPPPPPPGADPGRETRFG